MEKLTCDNYILSWERHKQWCVFKDATQAGSIIALFIDLSERVQAFELKVSCNSYGHLGLTPVDITGFVVPENHRYSGAPVGVFLRSISVTPQKLDSKQPLATIPNTKNITNFCRCDITLLMREGCKCGGG